MRTHHPVTTRLASAVLSTLVVVIVAVGASVGVGATTVASSPATSMDPSMEMPGGDGLLPPGDWTPDQRAFLLDLIDRTEAALPAFADPTRLESLGFHDFGIDAPGGYAHFINNSWLDDGRILDPTHPESLLFERTYDFATGEEHLRLLAAMYFLPTGTTMATIPDDLRWLPGWHVHPDICVTDDLVFTGLNSGGGSCSVGHPMTGPPMMHVWIVDNGCGDRFSMVDVTGLMCDLDMHEHETMPEPDPSNPPNTSTPPSTAPITSPDTTTSLPGRVVAPVAHPARPITARPTFTG